MQKLIGLLFVLIAVSGCASWQSTPEKLVMEHSWTQSTQKINHSYRRPNRAEPVLIKNMVVVSNSLDSVSAYNNVTGALIWSTPILNGSEAGPVLSDNMLFLGAGDGYFYALDIFSGKIIWSFSAKSEILAKPLVTADQVFFLAGNNVLFALEKKTGKQLWFYSRIDTANLTVRGASTPALRDHRLFVGFSDGFLLAFNAKDGFVLWERQLSTSAKFRDIDATPVLDESNLYVSSYDGALYSLAQADGQVVWSLEEGGYYPVVIDGDKIYYSSTSKKVSCLEKNTGKVLWSNPVQHGIPTTPAIWNQKVLLYGESSGNLVSLQKLDGKILDHYQPGAGILGAPVVDSKRAYFMSNEGNLHSVLLRYRKNTQVLPWERL